jgi:hypothetical protein
MATKVIYDDRIGTHRAIEEKGATINQLSGRAWTAARRGPGGACSGTRGGPNGDDPALTTDERPT